VHLKHLKIEEVPIIDVETYQLMKINEYNLSKILWFQLMFLTYKEEIILLNSILIRANFFEHRKTVRK
jgi:hypothetical protein